MKLTRKTRTSAKNHKKHSAHFKRRLPVKKIARAKRQPIKEVAVRILPVEPGTVVGHQKYVDCGFCGHVGANSEDLNALSVEAGQHGLGVCVPTYEE